MLKVSYQNRQNTKLQHFQYRLFEKLGEGFYGNVHKGQRIHDGKIVAVKTLKSETGNEGLKRFHNEVQFYRQFKNCSFVIDLLDYNLDGNPPFLITEYCHLKTAQDHLWEFRFNHNLAIGLLSHISVTLEQIHKLNVCHRDIKPSNLLLTTEASGKWIMKLGDPGMACFPTELARFHGATRTAQGTLRYMAPELFLPNAEYTMAADIYSFGITGIELFTMFEANNYIVPNTVPLELRDLLTAMICPNPTQRPKISTIRNILCNIYLARI